MTMLGPARKQPGEGRYEDFSVGIGLAFRHVLGMCRWLRHFVRSCANSLFTRTHPDNMSKFFGSLDTSPEHVHGVVTICDHIPFASPSKQICFPSNEFLVQHANRYRYRNVGGAKPRRDTI